MTVLALGRLGTQELDLGADLDLVFIAADQEARLQARTVVESFIHILSAYTKEGTLFQVDSRLRPRGKEGELVQTADGALDYFRGQAQLWEAAAFLKALPVVDSQFGERWLGNLREVLKERFGDWEEIRSSLLAMRARLEQEGTASGGEDNFKTGSGGVYDVDFALTALAFRAGQLRMGGCSLAQQIRSLQKQGALAGDHAKVFLRGVELFRAVDHAIRLITGKSSPVLPGGPRADVVADLISGWLGDTLSAATLVTRLAETRRAVRAVFERLFR